MNGHAGSTRPLRAATFGVLAALALAGCGGSNSGGGASAPPQYGSEEFGLTLEQLTVKVEQAEAAIGECMTAGGFAYVPLDFVSVKQAMDSDQSKPGLSDEQYIAQYGFGVTTQFDKPIVTFGAGPQNQATLAALAPADQVAYRRALWGEAPDRTLVRALEEEDFSSTGGCTKTAAAKAFTVAELSGSYVNPADKLLESDKRMVGALSAWSDCMREAGFDYEHPDAAIADLQDRLAALTKGQELTTLAGPAKAALAELQGEELAIAAADKACFEDNVEEVEAQIESEIYGAKQS